MTLASRSNSPLRVACSRLHHAILDPPLETRHQVNSLRNQRSNPREVHARAVRSHDAALRQRQSPRRLNVRRLSVRHPNERRQIPLVVQTDVYLHRPLRPPEVRPRKRRQTQVDGGRVQREQLALEPESMTRRLGTVPATARATPRTAPTASPRSLARATSASPRRPPRGRACTTARRDSRRCHADCSAPSVGPSPSLRTGSSGSCFATSVPTCACAPGSRTDVLGTSLSTCANTVLLWATGLVPPVFWSVLVKPIIPAQGVPGPLSYAVSGDRSDPRPAFHP